MQEEQENFAARVEDFKKTGTIGVMVSDHTAGESNKFQMKLLKRTDSTENIMLSIPRFVIHLAAEFNLLFNYFSYS